MSEDNEKIISFLNGITDKKKSSTASAEEKEILEFSGFSESPGRRCIERADALLGISNYMSDIHGVDDAPDELIFSKDEIRPKESDEFDEDKLFYEPAESESYSRLKERIRAANAETERLKSEKLAKEAEKAADAQVHSGHEAAKKDDYEDIPLPPAPVIPSFGDNKPAEEKQEEKQEEVREEEPEEASMPETETPVSEDKKDDDSFILPPPPIISADESAESSESTGNGKDTAEETSESEKIETPPPFTEYEEISSSSDKDELFDNDDETEEAVSDDEISADNSVGVSEKDDVQWQKSKRKKKRKWRQ